MPNNNRKFELLHILSLMNGELYLDVQEEDVCQIVEQLHGPTAINDPRYEYVKRITADHIEEYYPRLVEAAVIAGMNTNFQRPHYNSMINLFRMWHELKEMQIEIEQ